MSGTTYQDFFAAVARGLGQSNPSRGLLAAMANVVGEEGSNDYWNPFNIEWHPGSNNGWRGTGNFNSVGVQTYGGFNQGVQATIAFLRGNSGWSQVVNAVRNNDGAHYDQAMSNVYTWAPYHGNGGTGYLAEPMSSSASSSTGGGNYSTNSAGQQNVSNSPTAGQYKNAEGELGVLLTKIPALNKLLQKALASDQPVNDFINSVENSDWWKNHSSTVRQSLATKFSDPATYDQELNQAQDAIQRLSHQLGMSLNGKQLSAIATSAVLQGQATDTAWLTEQISHREDYSNLKDLSALTGGMANVSQQLQQMAGDYGFTWSPAQIAQHSQDVLDGTTTIDTYKQRLQSWAASAFPSLSKQIMAGTTVKDLADPYVQSMSNLLEVDPGTLSVYTPMIRKALQGTAQPGAKGADPTSTPLWQFEQQLRTDPRWAYTSNAHATMSSALLQIGSIFGFGPESGG